MATVELPATHVPMPHGLILDRRVSPGAVRLYGLLHYYGWTRQPADPRAAAAALGVSPRNVYRWAAELEAAGWLAYDRHPGRGGWGDRMALRDRRTPDTGVKSPPTFDTSVTTFDTSVTTFDTSVKGSSKTPHQDAAKTTTQILPDLLDPPPCAEVPRTPAGGGGEKTVHPETIQALTNAGVLKARAYGDIPPDVAQAAVRLARQHKNPQNLGGMIARLLDHYRAGTWEPPIIPVRAVTPPPLPAAPPLSDAERLAVIARYRKVGTP